MKSKAAAAFQSRSATASDFDIAKVVCYNCGKAGHVARDCPDQIAQLKLREELRAARMLGPLEELEARKICRKLQEIERIGEKVASGAKLEASQLKKMLQKSELEQLPVMRKISNGWQRDGCPQSELVQKITLTDEEEGHLRRFEKKIHKLMEQHIGLRAAIKVDHVQLESIQKEIDQLKDRDLFQKIAAGYRRATLDADSKCLAPAKGKMHASLLPSKAQPATKHVSQALECATAPVKRVVPSPVCQALRDADECSEASTVDTVDAEQLAVLEKAAEMLKASGLVAQAEELRKQAQARTAVR
jgi:rubrerythrin